MLTFRPSRTLLAAALAVAALPSLAADRAAFSRTVFIGDSLSDSGYFRPVLVQIAGQPAMILGRFTTNPGLVWSEHLARYYGTDASPDGNGQSGDNYAVGGARMVVDTVGSLGPTPSLVSQYTRYLADNGGRADPNALYTVWGGANDLFAVAANPSQAQAIIGAAVGGQVGIVAGLQTAGARYVLVPNIPDIGLTPQFLALGAAASAQASGLADTYNQSLYNALAGQGLRVIPLDTFSFLREAATNPALYGFSNVTGTACQPQITAQSITCNPGTYVAPGADRSYLFADGVHPSAAAHEMLGQLALSVIEGPRQIAVLPHSAVGTGRNRAERVAAQAAPGADAAGGAHWWTDVRGDLQRYDHGDHYDGMGPALLVGFGQQQGGVRYGGFVGYGRQDNDWGQRRGNWDQTEATLGAYLGWRSNNVWFAGQLSYTRLDFDVNRDVVLGPALRRHHASTDGTNLTLALSTGWDFGHGAVTHGPVLGVVAQRIDVDGFAEDGANLSTSLAYPDQSFDSLIGSVGWQANYQLSNTLRPYARVSIEREFEKPAAEAFAQSQSLPGTLPYAVPGVEYDRTWATATLGLRADLARMNPGLAANLGVSLNAAQKGGKHSMLFLSISSGF